MKSYYNVYLNYPSYFTFLLPQLKLNVISCYCIVVVVSDYSYNPSYYTIIDYLEIYKDLNLKEKKLKMTIFCFISTSSLSNTCDVDRI